jgi:hypothetical protein
MAIDQVGAAGSRSVRNVTDRLSATAGIACCQFERTPNGR